MHRHDRAMNPAAFYFWWIPDAVTCKRRKTRYRMSEATALEQHPGAEPVHDPKEVRHLPETEAELAAARPGVGEPAAGRLVSPAAAPTGRAQSDAQGRGGPADSIAH